MSLWTRSRLLPNTDKITTEEGPAAAGSPESTPGDTAPAAPADGTAEDLAEDAAGDTAEDAAGDGKPAGTGDDAGDGKTEAAETRGRRGKYPDAALVVTRGTTVLAAALVLFALLLPNSLTRLTPSAFLRVPVEGVLGAALLLVLPPKPRRIAAVAMGAGLGLLTILKLLDMGFYSTLDRPFDLVLDWILLDDGVSFLKDSVGRGGAISAAVGVVVLALALLVLMTLAVVRLSRLLVRYNARAIRTTAVLGTVWITCAALTIEIGDTSVASRSTTALLQNRVNQVGAGLRDKETFAKESAVDAFRDTPPDELLTGLRGKNVIFAFIESYGRSALEDPDMASQVDSVLADGNSRLKKAGFSSQSGFLTSPVTGAGSWLAHSTFLSGLWIKNEQRYRNLTSSDRLTLTSAFQSTDAWRTVGIMPGVTRSWPEGKFYGLDNVYDSRQLGYKGPKFSWTPVPDQYSLSAFERLEHGKKGRKPLMAEIILASSHNPWAPIPEMIGWDEVGDGSVYNGIKKAGRNPEEVWKDPDQVRTEYRRAVQYSLRSLISYVEKYGDKDTVLVFLGDHQPVPTVTRGKFGRDVPVSVVAHDPAVLDRIDDWGWQDGLKPGPQAPVWRMDTFRDRFLTAYGE